MSKWILAIMAAGLLAATGCQKAGDSTAAGAAAEDASTSLAAGFTEIESSLVKGVKYDEGSQVLVVQLNDGKVYEYQGVAKDVVDGLLTAESKGSYFATKIKDKFEGKQL